MTFFAIKVAIVFYKHINFSAPSKITTGVIHVVEAKMQAENETTAVQLLDILLWSGVRISLATVKNGQQLLEWTFNGTSVATKKVPLLP